MTRLTLLCCLQPAAYTCSIILNALAPHRLSTLPLLQPAPILSLK
jgi:hypothetical protein